MKCDSNPDLNPNEFLLKNYFSDKSRVSLLYVCRQFIGQSNFNLYFRCKLKNKISRIYFVENGVTHFWQYTSIIYQQNELFSLPGKGLLISQNLIHFEIIFQHLQNLNFLYSQLRKQKFNKNVQCFNIGCVPSSLLKISSYTSIFIHYLLILNIGDCTQTIVHDST